MLIVINTGQNQLKIGFGGFTFIAIIEHTENKMQENNGLISSLLKMFAMFEIRLSCGDK